MLKEDLEKALSEIQSHYDDVLSEAKRLEGEFRRVQSQLIGWEEPTTPEEATPTNSGEEQDQAVDAQTQPIED